jgi:hypothetical protein
VASALDASLVAAAWTVDSQADHMYESLYGNEFLNYFKINQRHVLPKLTFTKNQKLTTDVMHSTFNR